VVEHSREGFSKEVMLELTFDVRRGAGHGENLGDWHSRQGERHQMPRFI